MEQYMRGIFGSDEMKKMPYNCIESKTEDTINI